MSRPRVAPMAEREAQRVRAGLRRSTSSGSITLPFIFDIFSPFSSRTIACRYTVRNGTSSMKCRPIIIIRATQKKRMS